jgi:hypothetical protein
MLAIAIALMLGGCGGSTGDELNSNAKWGGMSEAEWRAQLKKRKEESTEADRKATEAKAKAEGEKKARQSQEAAAFAARTTTVAKAPAEDSSAEVKPPTGNAALLPPPPLPSEDTGEWDEHDLYVARLTGDPRLLDAIARRTARPKRTVEEARLLAELLVPRMLAGARDAANRAAGRGGPANASSTLVRAITEGLAANGTAEARCTLAEILGGVRPTEDPATALDGALAGLMAQGDKACDDLVVMAIVSPERALLEQQGPTTPEILRQRAIAMARSGASIPLRVELVDHLNDVQLPAAVKAQLLTLLREPLLANLPAQVALCKDIRLDPTIRSSLEAQMAAHAGVALQTMLELAPTRADAVRLPADAALIANQLWTDDFSVYLDVRLQGIGRLSDEPALLHLAASIPTDAVRDRLSRTLDRHWLDGPTVLRGGWTTSERFPDPGLLTVMRSVWRENTKTSASPGKPRSAQQNALQVAEQWEKAGEDLARLYCRRCQITALNRLAEVRTGAKSPGESRTAPEDLPIPPHVESADLLSYRGTWPGSLSGMVDNLPVAPLEMRYMRIEEKARPSRVASYYRRQLRAVREFKLPDGLHLVGQGEAASGRVRWLDVFVLQAKPDAVASLEDEQQLTIEAISIEVCQPGAPSPLASRTKETNE